MGDELKLCPNPACQSDDVELRQDFSDEWHYVFCGVCGMRGPSSFAAKAVIDWNSLPRGPAPAPLVWSSERPTVAGLYLSRQVGTKDFWLLVVTEESLSIIHKLPKVDAREFAGPIPEPMEPPK